jgi:hypothetical protein
MKRFKAIILSYSKITETFRDNKNTVLTDNQIFVMLFPIILFQIFQIVKKFLTIVITH